MRVNGFSGDVGDNFDWQARLLFHFKKDTPTVAATSFAVEALMKVIK